MTVTEENELELHDVVEEVNMSLLYFKAFFTPVSSTKSLCLALSSAFHENSQNYTLDKIASTKNQVRF